jgi:hypothetical protein
VSKRPGPVDAKRWLLALMAARDLPPWVRVVGGYIGGLHNPKRGFAYPSRAQIAEHTGIDQRHVVRAVKTLEESGWLSVIRGTGRGHSNEYRINLERVAYAPRFGDRKGGKSEPERVASKPVKGGAQRHPNYEDSNVREDSNWSPSAGRASVPSAPLAPPGTQGATQKGEPSAQAGEPSALESYSDAALAGGLALSSPPAQQVAQDEESMLREIAAAQFDWWNDLRFPELPPIHPATDSKYQTPEEVCLAWCEAMDEATAITGERALSVELYRTCGAKRALEILAKAAEAKRPGAYVRIALRNAKIQRERKLAKAHGASK